MAVKVLPARDYLCKRLDHNPETGTLTWRECADMPRRWNTRWAGKPALNSRHSCGYLMGAIDNTPYYAHRVIWKMMYGNEPMIIDHIDRDPTNNAISNLRSVTQVENLRNTTPPAGRVPGVMRNKKPGRAWIVRIYVVGEGRYIGSFDCFGAAVNARNAARLKLWGAGNEHQ